MDMTRRDEILKKIKETSEVDFYPEVMEIGLDLYKSSLIDELYAIEKAERILAWLNPSRISPQPMDNKAVGEIADTLVRMAQARHIFVCGERENRDYTKLFHGVEKDFFGGTWLTSLVYILDNVASQPENDQDQQE